VTCDAWQVVVVPFPFTDRATSKRRPALVLSRKRFNRSGHSVMAMVTSAAHQPWPGDTSIANLEAAGLRTPSLVRLKLFTLDNRFITRRLGTLDVTDQAAVAGQVREHIPVLMDAE
jgi:mRNA interferase MazF